MHLLLRIVTPLLWLLYSGQWTGLDSPDGDFTLSAAKTVFIGREFRGARPTVPYAHAMSLRNLATKFNSYKAVDWLVSLLVNSEVVLAGRLPEVYYRMHMAL